MSGTIQGAKGGGHTPVEDKDTLRSTQRGQIVDLLGEGPMLGLVNGLQSVYFDDVPVANPDGSYNVKDFDFAIQLGDPSDEGALAAMGFDDVQAEVAVGVEVTHAVPVVRSITDAAVTAVRVTINVPQLLERKSNGDVKGAKFDWVIEVQSNGGGYVQRYAGTVDGKCTSAYQRAVKVDLTTVGPPPWDIRVKRITADSTDNDLQDKFYWASYTRISALRMAYRHSAAVGTEFDAKNYGAIPVRAYDMMGFCEWEVPTNYNPLTRTYTGNWNGTFKLAWTNNPAWVFYGLVRHKRFGLGNYVATPPDKWTLYQLAQWCDGAVPDGRGGTEPRYTINCALMQQAEALRLLQDIAAVFRGAITYGAGAINAIYDAPSDPVALYAPANVVGGQFSYSDGSHSQKKSACTVWYNDLSQLGKRASVTYRDPELLAKYGLRPMPLDPIGCTSASQALRHAKWALFTTEMDQFVAFRVGSEGQLGRLGEVFAVSDPSEAGERLGGRLRSGSTGTLIKLDSTVELLSGETYTLWCMQPDPDDGNRLLADSRTVVVTTLGLVDQLTVSPAFTNAPPAQSMWMLEADTVAPTLWKYLHIEEVQGENGAVEFEITAMRHEPGKWALIEEDIPLNPRPIRRVPDGAPAPLNLSLTEVVYQDGQTFKSTLVVGWEATAPGLDYIVAWRYANGSWAELAPTRGGSVDIGPLEKGTVEIQVRSRNVKGATSEPPLAGSINLVGNEFQAADVVGLVLVNTSKGVLITCNKSPDFDYTVTEFKLDGANPDAATPLAEVAATAYNLGWPSVGTHVVWARHKRRGGPPGDWAFAGIDYTGPDLLIDQLDGRLSEEQFEAALQDRLDLIDGDGPGSVNERVAQFSLVGVNLVPGSGFDLDSSGDGVADFWHSFTGGTGDGGRVLIKSLVDPLNGGGQAQRLQISSATNSNDSGFANDTPDFPLGEGLTYTLSAWLRTAFTGVRLWARCKNASNGIVQDFTSPETPNDQLPHRMAITFEVPATAVSCQLFARGINAASEWFEVDALQFQTGPMAGPYMPNPADVSALSASVTAEIAARTTADTAFASSLSATQAQVATNSAAITSEETARASADSAMATSIDGVSARLAAKGSNLIGNSSFELDADGNGRADGWISYHAGNYGTHTHTLQPGRVTGLAQRSSATALGTLATDRHGVYRNITITAGSMANAKVSAYVKGTTAAKYQLQVNVYTEGVVTHSYATNGQLTAGWLRVSVDVPVLAGEDELRVYIWSHTRSSTGAATLDVDDVLVEPGTVLNEYSAGLGEAGSMYASVIEERTARVAETGELSAQWSVKVDANGRWAGIITRAGGDVSTIDLLANVVRIGSTDFADQALFVVYTAPTVVNGITLPAGIYVRDLYFGTLNGARIIADSITTTQLEVGSVTAAANDSEDSVVRTWPATGVTWTVDGYSSAGTVGVTHVYDGGTLVIRADLELWATVGNDAVEAMQFHVQLVRKPTISSSSATVLRAGIRTVSTHVWNAGSKSGSIDLALNYQYDPGELTEGASYYFGLYIVVAAVKDGTPDFVAAGSGSTLSSGAFIGTVENKV